ncbi:MAG: MFS transporter, partial [Gemmataceae bacterium]
MRFPPRNLALVAALLGWLFDGFEMGLFPVVGRTAIADMVRLEGTVTEAERGQNAREMADVVARWYPRITAAFLIGAATGGVLFGWIGDRFGRFRGLTLCVLTYSGCSLLTAFAQAPWQLAVFRFLGGLGMGGEWALGVALLMDYWPEKSRSWIAAMIGAAGNLGFALCGGVAYSIAPATQRILVIISFELEDPDELMEIIGPDWSGTDHWRLLMMIGVVPALLTFFLRLYVPEPPNRITSAGWRARDLWAVLGGAV